MSSAELKVARVSLEHWQAVVKWEQQEQWDIGLDDETHFMAADPQGFYMGFVDRHAVSSVSVVNFSARYAHVGHYLVDSRFRGQGIGLHTWKAAIGHDQAQACGLDSVVQQRSNYEAWGFVARHRVFRMSGLLPTVPTFDAGALEVITADNLVHAVGFDAEACGYSRHALLGRWFLGQGRIGWIYREGGAIRGVVGARVSTAGVRIGPLHASTLPVVRTLLEAVGTHFAPGVRLTIDVPDYAHSTLQLLRGLGFSELFFTFRMYRGEPPIAQQSLIKGLASLDLG